MDYTQNVCQCHGCVLKMHIRSKPHKTITEQSWNIFAACKAMLQTSGSYHHHCSAFYLHMNQIKHVTDVMILLNSVLCLFWKSLFVPSFSFVWWLALGVSCLLWSATTCLESWSPTLYVSFTACIALLFFHSLCISHSDITALYSLVLFRQGLLQVDRNVCLCLSGVSVVLSVLLWPLVVYHELIQKMYTGLEPILMKLDYSMKGDTQHRKHDKRSEISLRSLLLCC